MDRTNVARLRNCILALARSWLPIYDTTVMHAYEASTKYEVILPKLHLYYIYILCYILYYYHILYYILYYQEIILSIVSL